jgi:2-polyprenyl-3-methyl-5-hydroxy-6-metoxy-1,4-benzoquinol methylase
VTSNEGIGTEGVPTCLVCGTPGIPLYSDLKDRLFGAPGKWAFFQCTICQMAWLNPRPLAEELEKVYRTYYTHTEEEWGHRPGSLRTKIRRGIYSAVKGYERLADGGHWSLIGRVLYALPPLRELAALGTMCLQGAEKGKLLDVGCGNGEFLSLMRDAGWDVIGVEPDASAARFARERRGVPAFVGTLESAPFADATFDAITLKHVIEHVRDPVGLLAICRRLLKPQGRVVAVTPNIRSLGHEVFGECWRGLEPPRHAHVFSPAALRICFERAGLHVREERVSAQGAAWMWAASMAIKRSNGIAVHLPKKSGFRSLRQLFRRLSPSALMLQVREGVSQQTRGEELVLVGSPGAL